MPGPVKPGRAHWPRAVRLTSGDNIRSVVRYGRRLSGGWFRLVFWNKPLGQTRFAISVRKKVGNACVRNREKRCLRESLRTTRDLWPRHGWGVIVIDRPAPEKLSGKKRNKIIAGLLTRAQKPTGTPTK